MPQTVVRLYRDDDGSAPVLEWLQELRHKDRNAYAKCVARIERLAALGHEIRRPEADDLRDGVYELQARKGHVNYRVLYFFHGKNVALLAHALTKESAVPKADVDRAVERRRVYEKDPSGHTYEEEIPIDA